MTLFALVCVLLIAVLALLISISMVYGCFRYVPFVPTPMKIVRAMVDAAHLQDGDTVIDLGCGDGRFLIEARKKREVNAIGIEGSLFPFLLAHIKKKWLRSKHRLVLGNFYQEDLRKADVVFCYLFPGVMELLKVKFLKELKKGARIISYSFPIRDWVPVKTIQTRLDKPHNFLIYVYQI